MLGSIQTWVLLALGVELVRVMAVLRAVVGHSARLTLWVAEANVSGAGPQPREQAAAATVAHLRQVLMVLILTTSTPGSASPQAAEMRIRSPVVQ